MKSWQNFRRELARALEQLNNTPLLQCSDLEMQKMGRNLFCLCYLFVLLFGCAIPVKAADSGEHVFSDEEIDARLKIVSDGLMEGVWRSEELGGEIVIVKNPLVGESTSPLLFPDFYGFPVEELAGRRTYGTPVMFISRTHAVNLYSVTIKRRGTTSPVGTTVFSKGDNMINISLPTSEPGKIEPIRLIRVMPNEENEGE